jgi:hypothetical protein
MNIKGKGKKNRYKWSTKPSGVFETVQEFDAQIKQSIIDFESISDFFEIILDDKIIKKNCHLYQSKAN